MAHHDDPYALEPAPVFKPSPVPTVRSGRCARCGYDIAGLPLSADCPECSTPVAFSAGGDTLRFSAPEYIRKLHLGVTLILVALAAYIALVALSFTTVAFRAIGTVRFNATAAWLLNSAFLAASIVSVVGWWLLSSRDPRYTGSDDGSLARKIVRATVSVSAAVAAYRLLEQIALLLGSSSPTLVGLQTPIEILHAAVWTIWYFASLAYARRLGRRIPNEHIQQRATRLMYLGPLIVAAMVAVAFLGSLVPIGCVALVIAVAMLGALLYLVSLYWTLLSWVRSELAIIQSQQGDNLMLARR